MKYCRVSVSVPGPPRVVANTYSNTFIYQTGIQFFRLGSASSMAFVVLVVVLAVIVVAFRRMDRARERTQTR